MPFVYQCKKAECLWLLYTSRFKGINQLCKVPSCSQFLMFSFECLYPKQAGCFPHWPRISWLWQKEEVVGLYLLRSSSAGERLGSCQTCTVGNGCFAPRFKSGYTSPFWWSFWPFLNEVMSCRALATLFFIVDGGRNVPSQFLIRSHPCLIPQWWEPV